MELTQRAFAGEADFEQVIALRRAIAASLPNSPMISVAELRATYLEPFPGWVREVQLWEVGDQLVGLAGLVYPEERVGDAVAYLQPRIHPEVEAAVVGSAIVAWAEAEAMARLGKGVTLQVSVRREAPELTRVLESLGYRLERVFDRMERSIDEPLPTAPAAAGYGVRPLLGEAEVDAWLSLYDASFQDHYDFQPMNRDARVQDMRGEEYLPEFDLVAVDPEGSLAAFSWTIRKSGDGGAVRWHVHYVGTAREHRRRGLASNLLAETIARIGALGGGTIELDVDATSETGANRVYERLGFRVVSGALVYRRMIAD
jgi:mycothiol synthase